MTLAITKRGVTWIDVTNETSHWQRILNWDLSEKHLSCLDYLFRYRDEEKSWWLTNSEMSRFVFYNTVNVSGALALRSPRYKIRFRSCDDRTVVKLELGS